jgi:hypothetical protein
MQTPRETAYERIKKCKKWTTALDFAKKGGGVKFTTRCRELIEAGHIIHTRWKQIGGVWVKQYRYVRAGREAA